MDRFRFFAIAAVSTLMLSASPALAASDDAQIRFVHAVPGVSSATLAVDGQAIGEAGFAEASDQIAVPSGPARLALSAPGGVKLAAERSLKAGSSYTVVAMQTKGGAELRLFQNRAAKVGLARVRIIHAAPELGDGDFAIGDEVIAKGAGYTDQTDYLQVEPGDYRLSVRSPATGDTVLADTVPLAAGTSDTALLVGSQGEETRIVLVEDDVATPAGAPQTGFGGLAGSGEDGPAWPLALVAALAAGILGLGASLLLSPRRRFSRPSAD